MASTNQITVQQIVERARAQHEFYNTLLDYINEICHKPHNFFEERDLVNIADINASAERMRALIQQEKDDSTLMMKIDVMIKKKLANDS